MAKKAGAVGAVKKLAQNPAVRQKVIELAQNPAVRQKVIQLAKDPKVQAEVKKYAGLALEAVKNRKSGDSSQKKAIK